MIDYKIKVFCSAKYYNKCVVKEFDTWKDFLVFYDVNKYHYYFKICESYKQVDGRPVFNLLFNCGKYSTISKRFENFLELFVNPNLNREILRVFRHIRLDYLPSEIIDTYKCIRIFTK